MRAILWWSRAADQGNLEAIAALGELRQTAQGKSRRAPAERRAVEQAFRDYRSALWSEFPELTRNGDDDTVGAALLRQGRGAEAVSVLISEAQAFSEPAPVLLEELYYRGSPGQVPAHDNRILAYFTTAAASGSGAATAFEWSVYDRWLRAHQSVSPAPVVVVRDQATEARLGSGAWDRAVLAGLVTSLSRAGAAVIGLDTPLGQPSAPGRGGASSDALLSQAIALAENVVLPIALEPTDLRAGERPGATGGSTVPQHRSWPLVSTTSPALPLARAFTPSLPGFAQSAKSVGHTLAPADPDGVIRRVPLFVRVGDRGVPAFGLALAAAFTRVDADRIPVDRHGRMLVPP